MSIFFIGGSHGAGTAQVQHLLSGDASCHTPPETGYFRMLMEAYRAGKRELADPAGSAFEGLIGYRRFNADIVRRFLATHALARPQTQHWLFKDPGLTALFPEIFELLPDARFILLVRDPRDLVADLLEPDPSLKEAGVAHIFQRRRLRPLCRHLRDYYQPALRCELSGFRQRLHVLRYEDLVRKPTAIRAQLAAFTGMDLGAAAPQPPSAQSGLAVAGGPPLSGGGDGVGRYRQLLSRREASAVAVEMHDFFVTFGYA